MTDLSHLSTPGTQVNVRVTPNAARERIEADDGTIRIYVTVLPEDGKANAAVQILLARAMGIAKSRLTLIKGHSARDKTFRVDT